MGAERLWIMVDVETSGPSYGAHSLLEIGAAVGSRELGVVDRFSALLKPTSRNVVQSRATFRRAVEAGLPPREAMERLRDWAKPFMAAKASFVARPAAFDWPWIVHHAWEYLGDNPFGFKAVCASSWLESKGRRFEVVLPHVAVEDAAIQLEYFLRHL